MYARDPWGDRTVSVLLSHLITLLSNVHRDVKKHPLPITPDQILPPILPPLAVPAPAAAGGVSEAESFMAALRL